MGIIKPHFELNLIVYYQLVDFAGVVFQSTSTLSGYEGTRLRWDARSFAVDGPSCLKKPSAAWVEPQDRLVVLIALEPEFPIFEHGTNSTSLKVALWIKSAKCWLFCFSF